MGDERRDRPPIPFAFFGALCRTSAGRYRGGLDATTSAGTPLASEPAQLRLLSVGLMVVAIELSTEPRSLIEAKLCNLWSQGFSADAAT